MRRQECLTARRRPAVDGNLYQRLPDFIDGDTAGERCIYVNAELLKAAEASENSKRQKASSFLVKPGTALRITPSQFGNGPLKRHHEFIGTGEVCINILLAEHLLSHLQTLLKQIAIHHWYLLCPTDDRTYEADHDQDTMSLGAGCPITDLQPVVGERRQPSY